MSKWLARLRENEKNRQIPGNGTDKTPTIPERPIMGVLSVRSGAKSENFAAHLAPDDMERFDERAGILEYDCGLSRDEAERLARVQISETRH